MHQKEELFLSVKQQIEKLKMQLNKSKSQTRICKICFKEIKNNNLFNIFDNNPLFCNDCLSKLVPIFYHFKEDKIDCLALYKYDELVQSYLYQIKGCYDIELSPIFLSRYYRELSIYFSGYTIVPVPSWRDDDEIREFNHVEEIYKCLKLPIKKCLYKCEKYKQSDQNKDGRKRTKTKKQRKSNFRCFSFSLIFERAVFPT